MSTSFGRYEILENIGQGGMSEVFLALQRGPGGFEKAVALKRLLPHLANEPGFKEMFMDEARILSTLTHPNICQVFDFLVIEGRYCIAMEYLSGLSLSALTNKGEKEGKRLPPSLAAYIVACAAEGLACAHEMKGRDGTPLAIVHRDVSPQNIVVTYDGKVKLVDFGIARAATKTVKTEAGQIRGTIPYMSPEQVQGKPLDGRSDVFSLGTVLYELLSGRSPFRDQSDFGTMHRILSGVYDSLANEKSVPPALWQEVDAALQRNVEQRTPSARELARRLDKVIETFDPVPTRELLAKYVGDLCPEEMTLEQQRVQAITQASQSAIAPSPTVSQIPTRKVRVTKALSEAVASPHSRLRHAWVALGMFLILGAAGVVVRIGGERPRPSAVEAQSPVHFPALRQPPKADLDPAFVPNPQLVEGSTENPPTESAPRPDGPVVKRHSKTRKVPTEPLAGRVQSTPRETTRENLTVAGGRLTLDTWPWTDIYLGATKLGTTPLAEVSLPAGKHLLRSVNEKAQIDRVIEVTILPGQTTVQKVTW